MARTWNHRVIRTVEPDGAVFLGIHWVFYLEDGTPDAVTQDAVGVGGENRDELIETLDRMRRCLEKPILEMAYFDERAKQSET